jgi:1,4-dihydroxy-2-naphthoate octaprenyltransferase
LAFGLFGVFCAVFYTAPPISFGHHGFGEISMLVNFGSIIGLGAFYVQAQTFTLQAFLATLPLGIMLFSMIVMNEIPDISEDTAAGKLTLVARYGKNAGIKLYIISWICTYTIIAASALLGFIPLYTLASLLSLPLVIHSIRVVRLHNGNPRLMAPANFDMIVAHSLTSFGLIAGYAVAGVLNKANPIQLVFILAMLAVVYAPVAWALLSSRKKLQP